MGRTDIRRIDVELLRRGERGNQLLSKYTDYLGVSGTSRAGIVHVPSDHAEMVRTLDELRYEVHRQSPAELEAVRSSLGDQLALMLGAIPGLAGQLQDVSADPPLTHIRLTVSAAELALLPFEMSKIPVDAAQPGNDWLLLQAKHPVALTRHVRGIAEPRTSWSTRPRILFVSGYDVPFEEHLDAMLQVLEPWHGSALEHQAVERVGPEHLMTPWLSVLNDTNLDEIKQVIAANHFTHVHVLAHGATIEGRHQVERFGVDLGGRVVTGQDLALALTRLDSGQSRVPDVVTLATCDSAAQGSVVTSGGSVAFELHASGVPLVVASQFPITEDASIPFVTRFYHGQLNGEHPLLSVSDLRLDLKTRFDDEHAWASLVVYESLPDHFEAGLEELRYWQARRARDRALDDLRAATPSPLEDAMPPMPCPSAEVYESLVETAVARIDALPVDGAYVAECWGLRAAGYKILAEVAFWMSEASDVDPDRREAFGDECFDRLEQALDAYVRAAQPILQSGSSIVQAKANIHWLVGQIVGLQVLLGRDLDSDALGAARYSALADLEHPDALTKAWANVSLIELLIVQMTGADSADQAALQDEALERADRVIKLAGRDSEPARQTAIQMQRYFRWWGSEEFASALVAHRRQRPDAWSAGGAVVDTTKRLAQVLMPQQPLPPPTGTTDDGEYDTSVAPFAESFAVELGPDDHDAQPTEMTGFFNIEMVQAGKGDCLWIDYGHEDAAHHVLIDCGARSAAPKTAERITAVDEVELFVMTHIDDDHISGALPLMADPKIVARIREVWFNGRHQLRGFLSVPQGDAFTELLDADDRRFLWNGADTSEVPPPIFTDGEHPSVTLPGGLQLTVLSPTRSGLRRLARHWNEALRPEDRMRTLGGRRRPEPLANPGELDVAACADQGPVKDTKVPNLSSIAILAEFGGRAVLLTGDAHADVLAESIRTLQIQRGRAGQRLRLDALKLSHHGSATATTVQLLDLIDCSTYLIATSGATFYHPDREAIARVLVRGGRRPTLCFNYRTEFNELWENETLQRKYDYATVYPGADGSGLIVAL